MRQHVYFGYMVIEKMAQSIDRLSKQLEKERELTIKYLREKEDKEKVKDIKEKIKEERRVRALKFWPFN